MPSSPSSSPSSSPCAVPPANIPYGGHCRQPVPSCVSSSAAPQHELGAHTLYGNTASEGAFASRYGQPLSAGGTTTATGGGGGQKKKNKKPRRKGGRRPSGRRSCRTRSSRRARTQMSRRRRTHNQKRRGGGTGYYLDLASCPPGGRPSPVRYDSRKPPVFTVNGYPTADQARGMCQ